MMSTTQGLESSPKVIVTSDCPVFVLRAEVEGAGREQLEEREAAGPGDPEQQRGHRFSDFRCFRSIIELGRELAWWACVLLPASAAAPATRLQKERRQLQHCFVRRKVLIQI